MENTHEQDQGAAQALVPEGYTDVQIPVSPIDALKIQKEGFSMPNGDPPSVMSEALRKEIIRIATEGDAKSNKAFTVNVASHIERLVIAGRDILLAEKVAMNDLEALLKTRQKRKQHPLFGTVSDLGTIGGQTFQSDSYYNDLLEPLTNTSPTENFGMSAIRQLVDGMKSQSETPEKLVNALVAAKAAGLTEVVASLEVRLGVKSSAALPAVVAPTVRAGDVVQSETKGTQ